MSQFASVRQRFEFDTRDAQRSMQQLGRASSTAGKQHNAAMVGADKSLNTFGKRLAVTSKSQRLFSDSTKGVTDAMGLVAPQAAGAARALRGMTDALIKTPLGAAALAAGALATGIFFLARRTNGLKLELDALSESFEKFKPELTLQERLVKGQAQNMDELSSAFDGTRQKLTLLNQHSIATAGAFRAQEERALRLRVTIFALNIAYEEQIKLQDRLVKQRAALEGMFGKLNEAWAEAGRRVAENDKEAERRRAEAMKRAEERRKQFEAELERSMQFIIDLDKNADEHDALVHARYLDRRKAEIAALQAKQKMLREVTGQAVGAGQALDAAFREAMAERVAPLEMAFGVPAELDLMRTKLDLLGQSFQTLTAIGSETWGVLITGSEGVGSALKSMAGDALLGLSMEMFGNALKHGAMAIGALALQRPDLAAMHGKAAAMHGAGAAATGALARAMGAGSAAAGGGAGISPTAGRIPRGGGGGGDGTTVVVGNDWSRQSPRQRAAQLSDSIERARRYEDDRSGVRRG
jgi:hypothetical protein